MLSSFSSKSYIFSFGSLSFDSWGYILNFLTRIVSILVLTRRNNSFGINKLITSLLNRITSFWVSLASLDNFLDKNVTSAVTTSNTTDMSLFLLIS